VAHEFKSPLTSIRGVRLGAAAGAEHGHRANLKPSTVMVAPGRAPERDTALAISNRCSPPRLTRKPGRTPECSVATAESSLPGYGVNSLPGRHVETTRGAGQAWQRNVLGEPPSAFPRFRIRASTTRVLPSRWTYIILTI
jgi:hypothetical protein